MISPIASFFIFVSLLGYSASKQAPAVPSLLLALLIFKTQISNRRSSNSKRGHLSSLRVPIIATAVQEELQTGSAASGDASSAATTVWRPLTPSWHSQTDEHLLCPGFAKIKTCHVIRCVPWEWRPEGFVGFVSHPQAEKHHPALVKLLCAELGVEPEALLDFELCLTDTQPAVRVQISRRSSAPSR